jgi:hypothetical protein
MLRNSLRAKLRAISLNNARIWRISANSSFRIVKKQAHDGTLEASRFAEELQQLLLAAPGGGELRKERSSRM